MVTEKIWEGHMTGIFEGYAYDRLHMLSDCSNWRQLCEVREHVYREQPRARLVWNQSVGRMYLDVEGTSAIVLVARDRGISRGGSAAFLPRTGGKLWYPHKFSGLKNI